MEEDVIIREEDWLSKLLQILKMLPSRVAILSPDVGSRLCIDFVGTSVTTNRKLL